MDYSGECINKGRKEALLEKSQARINKLLAKHSVEEIYDMVLSGELVNFPRDFWNVTDSLEYAKKCVRHLFEDILQLPTEDIPSKYSHKLLVNYKLYGMLSLLFKGNIFDTLDNAYKGTFKPFMLNKVSKGYWTAETCAEAIRWLIEDKLKWSGEEVIEKFGTDTLKEYSLNTLNKIYSIPQMLEIAYPGKYEGWNLKYSRTTEKDLNLSNEDLEGRLEVLIDKYNFVPWEYTPNEWALQARRGFFKTIEKDDFYERTCQVYFKLFPTEASNADREMKESWLKISSSSPVEVYKVVLRGRLTFPRKYWQGEDRFEKAAICVRYLVEEVLKLEKDEDILKEFTVKTLSLYYLKGMLFAVFSGSVRDALANAYPERFAYLRFKGLLKHADCTSEDDLREIVALLVKVKFYQCKEEEIPLNLK